MHATVVLALGLLVGCAAAAEERRPVAASAPSPLTGASPWVADAEPGRAPSRTLFRQSAACAHGADCDGYAAITIGERAPPSAPTRPRSRGRIDVSLRRADLENAARLLADAGRFNVVVESGLTGSVTADLRGVDAFDALVAIAEANGAVVRYERGIVMVRKRGQPEN